MDFTEVAAAIGAKNAQWRRELAGEYPPKRISRRLKAVAQALVRSECAPGLWSPEETEKLVRREWKRHLWLWRAAVALHAADSVR